MQIWVDADACPRVIKEILYRAADRLHIQTSFVANRPLRTPGSPYISSLVVAQGFDIADDEIVNRMRAGDLVISADIPLAAQVIVVCPQNFEPKQMRVSSSNKEVDNAQ